MTADQAVISLVLAATMGMFLWARVDLDSVISGDSASYWRLLLSLLACRYCYGSGHFDPQHVMIISKE